MSATKRPGAVGLRRGLAGPQVRSDESIGRPEDIGTHPEAVPLPRPPKPVRVTVDLDQDRYRTLQAFRGTQITAAAVFRAFLDELEEDNELAARIAARIWAAKRR